MSELAMSGVAIRFGATTILENVTVTVDRGSRWGIVGRNGSGKTSLFRLITGEGEPATGTVTRLSSLRVTRLDQHRDFGDDQTVWQVAAGAFAELLALEISLAEQATNIGELGDRATAAVLARYSADLERFQREGGYQVAARIDAILHGLGFDPEESRTTPVRVLSGGERGRLGLARELASPGDLLLLDEPTNHLDLDTTDWLVQYLAGLSTTALIISHDRSFLDRVADHILHLERGTAFSYAGNYSAFAAQRAERRRAERRAFEKQSAVIAREEDYIRRNIAGQNSRQASGRRRRLERLPRLSPPPEDADAMALRFTPRERGGEQVIVLDHVSVAAGGRELVRDFTATVRRGDVIGLVGPNGAGKSTLLRSLVGERPPAAGAIRLGAGVTLGYYSQDLSLVPRDRTIYDLISDLRPTWTRGQIQHHLGRFGFSGDAVRRNTSTLSGGELARVALAMLMLSDANLLVFDEPTNHLDVESIEALEDAFEIYDGTAILVSHDRALLRSLATRVWILHDGRITDFEGTFTEWETLSAERARAAQVRAAED
ncbi:MAG: ABC-F family ATP-binding cassette domain-containing protein, partial [Gemmatimonadota bacterium]